MGFKPRNLIKPYFHVRPSQFLYPDETVCPDLLFKLLAVSKISMFLQLIMNNRNLIAVGIDG